MDESFQLRDGWHISFHGVVPVTTWDSKGAAEAQLSLLRSGYSQMGEGGVIRHVGASRYKKAV